MKPRLIRTPGYYGQFRLSRRSYIFSKINPLLMWTPVNTDNGHFCVLSDKLSYIVNPALLTLFICVLSRYFQLSKDLSNIQFHVAESQTKSVRRYKEKSRTFSNDSDSVFQEQVILRSETVINEPKVSLICTCCSYRTFCCRKHVCFSLCIDKICVRDVFLRARLIRTPG